MFREWEEAEHREPSLRKACSDGHVIYKSHEVRLPPDFDGWDGLIVSDFGEGRIGLEHEGLIQPNEYRAPEVLLGMKWGPKVDIWNLAVAVSCRG